LFKKDSNDAVLNVKVTRANLKLNTSLPIRSKLSLNDLYDSYTHPSVYLFPYYRPSSWEVPDLTLAHGEPGDYPALPPIPAKTNSCNNHEDNHETNSDLENIRLTNWIIVFLLVLVFSTLCATSVCFFRDLKTARNEIIMGNFHFMDLIRVSEIQYLNIHTNTTHVQGICT